MTTHLLGNRVDAGDHWRAVKEAMLFVALVHPVFAKYATAPQSTLIRCLDLHYLLAQQADERHTLKLASQSGLKTAAWIMLRWLELLSAGAGLEIGESLQELLRRCTPGTARRAYLNYWITQNLSTHLKNLPAITQAAFTLVAHDTSSDARTAIGEHRRAMALCERQVQSILRLTPLNGNAEYKQGLAA